MKSMTRFSLSALTLSLSLFATSASACTEFSLKAQDESVLVARSMEFTMDLKSNLRTSPEGREFQMPTLNGKPGMSWKAKYGYVFTDSLGQDAANDGMNEAGLSFGALYLPGETQYQTVPAAKENEALPYIYFGDWVLSNFKTVDEVRRALSSVYIYKVLIPNMGQAVFPLHFSIYDASGQGIVVEYIDGKLHIDDNKIGVLTNSPTYDWQVTNLRNYVNLSPYTPKPVKSGNLVFVASGQGSGMKGLPGDISPPSRFVKMAVLKNVVYQPTNAAEALNTAQHMINNVDIPAGYVRADDNGKVSVETTQWTVFKDLTHKMFYYHTYGDTTLHSINLAQLDFSPKAIRLKMPLADSQFIVDDTQKLMASKSN